MDEQSQSPLEGFDGNPFEAIMQQMQSQQSQPAPQPSPQTMGQGMQGAEAPPDNQLMKGKNPDNTQNLIGAVKSIQSYIASSVDPAEITIARSIVRLLSKLIEKDQTSMTDQLPKDQQMAQAMSQGQ